MEAQMTLVAKYKMPRERAAGLINKARQFGSWESEIFGVQVSYWNGYYDVAKL